MAVDVRVHVYVCVGECVCVRVCYIASVCIYMRILHTR